MQNLFELTVSLSFRDGPEQPLHSFQMQTQTNRGHSWFSFLASTKKNISNEAHCIFPLTVPHEPQNKPHLKKLSSLFVPPQDHRWVIPICRTHVPHSNHGGNLCGVILSRHTSSSRVRQACSTTCQTTDTALNCTEIVPSHTSLDPYISRQRVLFLQDPMISLPLRLEPVTLDASTSCSLSPST